MILWYWELIAINNGDGKEIFNSLMTLSFGFNFATLFFSLSCFTECRISWFALFFYTGFIQKVEGPMNVSGDPPARNIGETLEVERQNQDRVEME
jgi:hypothetical protein